MAASDDSFPFWGERPIFQGLLQLVSRSAVYHNCLVCPSAVPLPRRSWQIWRITTSVLTRQWFSAVGWETLKHCRVVTQPKRAATRFSFGSISLRVNNEGFIHGDQGLIVHEPFSKAWISRVKGQGLRHIKTRHVQVDDSFQQSSQSLWLKTCYHEKYFKRFFDLEDTFADVIMFPVRNSPGFHHSFINKNTMHHGIEYLLSTRFTIIWENIFGTFFKHQTSNSKTWNPQMKVWFRWLSYWKVFFFEVPGCNFQTFSRVDGLPPVLLGTFKPLQQTLGSASEVSARNPRLQRPGIV